ncbi:MAG: DUF3489 domain-containing protein [Rhodospirillaceae bacterium]|nr:DUF3489 domain-containing protein [Rhodospirillaceae bacterium]
MATRQSLSNTPRQLKRKRPTRIDAVLKLLRRANGASIAELRKATGWQPHSVRAALTGLRKRDVEIVRSKDQAGTTRYTVKAG